MFSGIDSPEILYNKALKIPSILRNLNPVISE